MKVRIKFRKYGVMRFIGHLDIMRYFQKAIRRAEIPIAYTEGFSPHQVMSFAAPLGVGLISDGEYLDIEVHDSLSTKKAIEKLNQVMVEGIEITNYVQLPKGAGKAMAIVAAAEYEVFYKNSDPASMPFSYEEIREGISRYFHERDTIMITKTTKKGERTLDIRPHIYRLEAYRRGEETGFSMLLSAGSQENIKPELVVQDFFQYFGKAYDKFAFQIRRVDVYAEASPEEPSGSRFLPLDHFGEQITNDQEQVNE